MMFYVKELRLFDMGQFQMIMRTFGVSVVIKVSLKNMGK